MKISNDDMAAMATDQIVNLHNLLWADIMAKKNKPFVPLKKVKDRLNMEQRLYNLLADLDVKAVGPFLKSVRGMSPELIANILGEEVSPVKTSSKGKKKVDRTDAQVMEDDRRLAKAMRDTPTYDTAAPTKAGTVKAGKVVRVVPTEKTKQTIKTLSTGGGAAVKMTPERKSGVVPAPPPKAAPTPPALVPTKADEVIFSQLGFSPGDCVVHKDYGTCRYRGTTKADGVPVLLLEFARKEILYLPFNKVSVLDRCKNRRKSITLSRLAKNAKQITTAAQVDKFKTSTNSNGLSPKAGVILKALRETVDKDGEGDEAYTDSTTISKEVGTSTTVVCNALIQLERLGLVKLEDESPDDKHQFMYIYVLPPAYSYAIPEVAVKLPGENRGPRSPLTSKLIFRKTKDNPRREGTWGHKSFALIKDGMTYEAYKAAGGRNNDLMWDVEHGHLELRDKK